MIERNRSFAILPHEQRQEIRKVDSANFLDYLRSSPVVNVPRSQFADNLSLEVFAPAFSHLYEDKQMVKIYKESPAETAEREAFYDKVIANPLTKDLGQEMLEKGRAVLAQEDAAERSTVIYKGPLGNISYTDPLHGDYTSTKSQVYDMFAQKLGYPLLEVHTHPDDALFSPADYSRLLLSYSGLRVIKGMIVLCPRVQLLALTTNSTPHLSSEKVAEFVGEYNDKIDVSFAKKQDAVDRILDLQSAPRIRRRRKDAKFIKDMIIKEDKGQITDEEFNIAMQNYWLDREAFNSSQQKYSEKLIGLVRRIADKTEGKVNSSLIEFSRRSGVKLYMSTDRVNFKAMD